MRALLSILEDTFAETKFYAVLLYSLSISFSAVFLNPMHMSCFEDISLGLSTSQSFDFFVPICNNKEKLGSLAVRVILIYHISKFYNVVSNHAT